MMGMSKLAKHFLSISYIIGVKFPVEVSAEESSILDGASVI